MRLEQGQRLVRARRLETHQVGLQAPDALRHRLAHQRMIFHDQIFVIPSACLFPHRT